MRRMLETRVSALETRRKGYENEITGFLTVPYEAGEDEIRALFEAQCPGENFDETIFKDLYGT